MAVEAAHRRAESILESIGEAFYALDAELRFRYVNPLMEQLSGVGKSDLLGRMIWDVFPQLVGNESYEAHMEVMRERRPIHYEAISTLTGRWIESNVYPSDDGGITVYFRDIHDRQQAREELARREREYAALVDNAPDILARIGSDLHVQYINHAVERMTGFAPNEFIGKTVADIAGAPGEDMRIWEDAIHEVFRTGQPRSLEFSIPNHTTADSDTRHMEVSLTPEIDSGGNVISVISVTHDITDRVKGEMAVAEAAANQRQFLREMLAGFTEGRLRLCFSQDELPALLPTFFESIELTEASLFHVRERVADFCRQIHFSDKRIVDITTATHEAAMNAIRHAGGGVAKIYGDVAVSSVQVWIQDQGAGIAEELIHRAVERGFTTGGFGQGFFLMQSLSDRLYFLTGKSGTTVVVELRSTAPEPGWLR